MPGPELYHHSSDSEILLELQKAAGRIVFYVSGSNWVILLGMLKNSLSLLQSISTQSDPDGMISLYIYYIYIEFKTFFFFI